jgi:CheY-like chemotaxis protein
VEVAADGFSAIDKLRDHHYAAVVLDPMIRQGLNGFAVLTYIELEQPEVLHKLFLLTGLSVETITRTAPFLLPRLFRKPSEVMKLASAITARHESSAVPRRTESITRVLLVEDDDETAQSVSKLVQGLGYGVTIARGGREALVELSSSDFAVVILELVMPDFDGFTLLEYIETMQPELLRRVIVTTGMPETYLSSIAGRVCAVLHKPVDAALLQAALDRCVPHEPFEAGGSTPQLG